MQELIAIYWDTTVASSGGSPAQGFGNLTKAERILLYEIWAGSSKMDYGALMKVYDVFARQHNVSSVPREYLKKFVGFSLLEQGHSKTHSVTKKLALPVTVGDFWRSLFRKGLLELELTVKYKLETNESYIEIRDARKRGTGKKGA